ncbi:MAG: hypothetical protein JRH20_06920 [Deltaproteobacteria bacterium]|nr:hypothetical protein [Deltaproteobacteria bacterium]
MKSKVMAGMLVFCATLAVACGGDEDALGINNVTPKGSVGGVIIDLSTGEPISGVTVSVVAGALTLPPQDSPVVTDARGMFSVSDVPAGQVIVVLEPPSGYLPVRIQATLDDAAGEFPRDNATLSLGPIALAPLAPETSPFVVRLLLPSGAPASGVKASARVSFSWAMMRDDRPTAHGLTLVEAVSDGGGLLVLKGLPDLSRLAALDGQGGINDQVQIWVPPVDVDNDGLFDFLGTSRTFQVNTMSTVLPTVVLNSIVTQLDILATTIPGLDGTTGTRVLPSSSGPFFVAFNLPLDQKLTSATLYDGDGVEAEAPTLNIDGTLLTLNFTNLVEGQEYNLNLRAVARANGNMVEKTLATPFFAPTMGDEVTMSLTRESNLHAQIKVTFNLPVGTGNSSQNSLPVVFVDYDLDEDGTKGNYPGEIGATSSNLTLTAREEDPPGLVGLSGYTRRWSFNLPSVTDGLLPSGTTVQFHLAGRSPLITRASGELVDDFVATVP